MKPYNQMLQEVREKRGLKVRDAAYLSKVTEPTIRALEAGRGNIVNLKRYLEVLELEIYAKSRKNDEAPVFT